MTHYGMIVAGLTLLLIACGGGTQTSKSPEPASDEAASPAPAAETAESAADDSTSEPAPAVAENPSGETTSSAPSTEAPADDTAPAAAPAGEKKAEVKEAINARITDKHIVISGKIQFETGKAKLKKVSFEILDEVVFALEKHPEIIKLQIIGHTDGDGDANANKRLSKRRATAVMQYLIRNGIEKDRLSAVGAGEDVPIASNDTEEGKEKNRRVEFSIVERAKVVAKTHTTSTVDPGKVDSRKATDDETEELIKKEGLDKKF